MSKIAFLYAGQGSQKVGMGSEMYETDAAFRAVMEEVDPTGRYRELCFHGPIEELSKTENTQPCMVAFAAAMSSVLAHEGIRPDYACGLSLGEYSALCAAGVFTPKQAVETVCLRGRAMKDSVVGIESGMTAVLGLSREQVLAACKKAQTYGVVEATNYNCPGQIVISGEAKAVEMAAEFAKEAGAKRCLPLPVSGPFHTSFMKPAARVLAEHFTKIPFGDMQVPVVFNCTAQELRDGETVASLLERQVAHSVYFEDTILYLAKQGVDTMIEIGPGKTLCGFVKKTLPELKTFAVEDPLSMQQLLETL